MDESSTNDLSRSRRRESELPGGSCAHRAPEFGRFVRMRGWLAGRERARGSNAAWRPGDWSERSPDGGFQNAFVAGVSSRVGL